MINTKTAHIIDGLNITEHELSMLFLSLSHFVDWFLANWNFLLSYIPTPNLRFRSPRHKLSPVVGPILLYSIRK